MLTLTIAPKNSNCIIVNFSALKDKGGGGGGGICDEGGPSVHTQTIP